MSKFLLFIVFSIVAVYSFSGTVIVTNTNNSGTGSLRASVAAANAGDTIRFSPSLIASGSDSIVLTNALSFNKSLTLIGLYNSNDTLFISGGNTVSILSVISADNVVLDSLVVVNGRASFRAGMFFRGVENIVIKNCIVKNCINYSTSTGGGGINFDYFGYAKPASNILVNNSIICKNKSNWGGGIYASKSTGTMINISLIINNSIISNNTSTSSGGGVGSHSIPVEVNNSTISDNNSTSSGGGIHLLNSQLLINSSIVNNNISAHYGGGIYAHTVGLSNTTISNNFAQHFGGGVYIKKLISKSSIISGNHSGDKGGGIYVDNTIGGLKIEKTTIQKNKSDFGGGVFIYNNTNDTAIISQTTFNDNKAILHGGGLYIEDWYNCKLSIITSTFVNDSAIYGGGIYVKPKYSTDFTTLKIENSTIVKNLGNQGAGIYYLIGNSSSLPPTNIFLSSSIVALNGVSNIFYNQVQTIASSGFNILGDSAVTGRITSDIFSNDSASIKLGALQNNGGLTYTRIPLLGSIALNNGDTSDFSNAQNWLIRDSLRDVGAAENTCNFVLNDTITKCDPYISRSGRHTWQSTGIYTDTIFGNCDTLIITKLTVQNTFDTIVVSSCFYYILPSGKDTVFKNGQYVDTILNSKGCDSILTINLTLNNTSDSISTCGTYTNILGTITYNSPGTYFDTTSNSKGCDSIIKINILNNTPSFSNLTLTTCSKYILPSGKDTLATSGVYKDTISNFIGCDSVITISLTILPTTYSTINVSKCDSFLVPSGLRYETTSKIFNDTILNKNGCDSIITINLTILKHSIYNTSAISCEPYVSPSGNIYTTTGLYYDYLINSVGCDSIITTLLTIHSLNTGINQTGIALSADYSGGIYQWLNCDSSYSPILGETNQYFTPSINGNYAVIVKSPICSDTSTCLKVNSVGVSKYQQTEYKLYPNPAKNFVILEIPDSETEVELKLFSVSGKEVSISNVANEKTVLINLDNVSTGIYNLQIIINNTYYYSKLIIK